MNIDYNEELEYIVNKTGLDKDIIEKVLDADYEFLEENGLAYTVE